MKSNILELVKLKGTPFYLFDEQGFISNYCKLVQTFRKVYPNYNICYSYKTNYTPYICNLVKTMGGLAEVVSDMEYQLARKLGYANKHIVYNGPAKGVYMYEHILNGGILNIDSLDEAKRIVSFASQHPKVIFKLGIRVNLDLGGDFISRFGLVPESDEMETAVTILKSLDNVKLVGLHCHISRSRGLEAWMQRAQIMLFAADKYIDGIPEYISLGSGMFAEMTEELKCQFFGGDVPSYEDYCRAAIMPFAEHYRNSERMPDLYTEPGTTIVARYIEFVSKVLSIKNIRGRFVANMDGDYHNLGEICTMKKLPVRVFPSGTKQKYYPKIDIMGFTCLEQDIMREDFEGYLAEGDIILFENVGGYSIVAKPPFIQPQSGMYAVRPTGEIIEIMRSENFDDIFCKFNFEF